MRHFILTSPRSGSNFLTATLNAHPAVMNFGEVLGGWTPARRIVHRRLRPGLTEAQYLDFIYHSGAFYYGRLACSAASRLRRGKALNLKWRGAVTSIGVKDFAYLIRQAGLGDYLAGAADMKIIYLKRENTLKQHVSFERMRETKVVSTQAAERNVLLELKTPPLLAALRGLRDADRFAEDLVDRLPPERVMRIRYEDYFFDPDAMRRTNDRLFAFLGVAPIDTVSGQRKISPDDLRAILRNYDEVARTLAGTEFETQLD